MLAANDLTRRLLSQVSGRSVHEYAHEQSAQSIRRFLEKKNRESIQLGLRFEYDEQIIRCVATDETFVEERLKRGDEYLAKIDPIWPGAPDQGLLSAIRTGIVWWYDLKHLTERYVNLKEEITSMNVLGAKRLKDVPVVIGGDWEFNAWACPAELHGDFIMVNFGFIQIYCYAAMFFEMLDERKEAAEKGQASGIITSSMIWMAATTLGYEPFQWDNLRLPSSEYDQIWNLVQHPSDRLRQAIVTVDAFAMLHECGHIACGHTDRLREWLLDVNPSEPERLERLGQMRDMEFEADRYACRSLCPQGLPSRECFDALLIIFTMLRLCEDGRNILSSLTSTHPCATDRYHRCLKAIGDDGVGLLEKVVGMIVNSAKKRLEWQDLRKANI